MTDNFPHFIIVRASAGSGKTYALTKRYVSFLLSEEIPRNSLKNILAITFANNAAIQIKEKILSWLKSICLGDQEKIEELLKDISIGKEELIKRAENRLDEILNNYTDFQIRTIDSFMATLLRASSIDLGYPTDFEILMKNDSIIDYAFSLFLRQVKEGTNEGELLLSLVDMLQRNRKSDSPYLWEPSREIIEEIKEIYRKLSSIAVTVKTKDILRDMETVQEDIKSLAYEIEGMIEESGLDRHGRSTFPEIITALRQDRYADLIDARLGNIPVKKTDSKWYKDIHFKWIELKKLILKYKYFYAYSYYLPYLNFYRPFIQILEKVKRLHGKVFIEDLCKELSVYIDNDIVPDVYFRIGDVIFHFLIDEFQDTSPIQWKILFPLIENSISLGGSLFVVGDTKQAIYGFRNADYRIMKSLEKNNPFPSAKYSVEDLDTNYRSQSEIIEFNKRVFTEIAPSNDKYMQAAKRSGLADFTQKAKSGNNWGYVEIDIFEKNIEEIPEMRKVTEIIAELINRGYRYRDIAILASRNENVINITKWLNNQNIQVISYSSLDIRKRTITGEIISLLKFLDSPIDDLSFVTFILGDLFKVCLTNDGFNERDRLNVFLFKNRNSRPIYKAFQEEFPVLWERYFEELFKSAGYLPLYDLTTKVFCIFNAFSLQDEEATLAKILEVIKDFEDKGNNSVASFFDFALNEDNGKSEWDIDIPKGTNAVKVMTIHQAKGLGFPVVILLLYSLNNKGFEYILSEEEDGVYLLKLTKNIVAENQLLEQLYDEERINEGVNRLNSLYVGLTRAEKEMYIIGVKAKNESYPFDLLPSEKYTSGDKSKVVDARKEDIENSVSLFHHDVQLRLPVDSSEIGHLIEKRRGEFIHRVLYFVEYIEDNMKEKIESIIKRIELETGEAYRNEEMTETIIRFLNNTDIIEYFTRKNGREIKNEQEFLEKDGRLYRMDRVVIDRDMVTVIDYKTGSDISSEEEYIKQLNIYKKLLKGIYPERKIHGIIAYIDLNEIRRVI